MAAFTDNSSPPCALCGAAIVGYGHNAAPMAQGKCCDTCNLRVIAARFSHGHRSTDNAGQPNNKEEKDSSPPCVLCGEEIKGNGHAAEPMAQGKCCSSCYLSYHRISEHLTGKQEVFANATTERPAPLEKKFCAICQSWYNKGMVFPCCEGFICWEEGNPEHQCALQFRMSRGKKTKIILHPDGTLEQVDPPTCPYCRTPIPSYDATGQMTAMLRKKAVGGRALDQFALAKYLYCNVDTPDACKEAYKWIVKSATQHFPGAMHTLADLQVKKWTHTRDDTLVDQAIDLLTRCVGQPHITTEMLVQPLCLFTRELYVTADVLPRNMSHAHTMPLWLRVAKACSKKKIPVGCANCDSIYVLNMIKHHVSGTPGVGKIGNPRKPGTKNWCPCMAVRYCSKKCQREHWKSSHKKWHKHYLEVGQTH